jgi:hypothetical protein
MVGIIIAPNLLKSSLWKKVSILSNPIVNIFQTYIGSTIKLNKTLSPYKGGQLCVHVFV